MANTSRGPERQVEVVVDVGGLDFGLYVAIVVLIHVVYNIALKWDLEAQRKGKTNMKTTLKWERRKSTYTIYNLS